MISAAKPLSRNVLPAVTGLAAVVFLLVAVWPSVAYCREHFTGLSFRRDFQDNQDISHAQTWAVVVGISTYGRLPGGLQLQFADSDAKTFAARIEAGGVSHQNIRLLTDREATTTAIKSAIGTWLAKSASEGDTVYIFFSGHGYVEKEFGDCYWLAYDSDPADPYATGISIDDLGRAVKERVKAGRVLIIQDAIRRDFFDPDGDGPALSSRFSASLDALAATRPGVSVLAASSPGEFSWEGRRWGSSGVFTKFLTDGLSGAADRDHDGDVTYEEMFDYLAERIPQETSNKQHPWRSNPGRSDPGRSTSGRGTVASATAGNVGEGQDIALLRMPSPGSRIARGKLSETRAGSPEARNVIRAPSPHPQPPGKDRTASGGSLPNETVPNTTGAANRDVGGESATPTGKPVAGVVAGGPGRPPQPVSRPPARAQVPAPGSAQPVRTQANQSGGAGRVVTGAEGSTADPRESNGASQAESVSRAGAVAATSVSSQPARPEPAEPPRSASVEAVSPPVAEGARPALSTGSQATGPAAPRPLVLPPTSRSVPSTVSARDDTAPPAGTIASGAVGAAPSPLPLELETAIREGNLVEPKGYCAWDLYQQLISQTPQAETGKLKSMLADALLDASQRIVAVDVRYDIMASRVDDFKHAGQLLARLRELQPGRAEAAVLQKLSAVEALIALQFYDDAEQALARLETSPTAAVENTFGLVYQGGLDDYRAERAYKRAIELDPHWAAPHYNLALLYNSQKKDGALPELEEAAKLAPSNSAILEMLGDQYFSNSKWAEAEGAYRKAISTGDKSDRLHTKLGHALYSQGLRDQADKEYKIARELAGQK